MQARLIAYPPDSAAAIRLIQPDGTLHIGRARGGDADHGEPGGLSEEPSRGSLIELGAAATPALRGVDQLVLDHPSVSRRHAELHAEGSGWRLLDCGSKNGSYVDGIAVSDARLQQACWLRFGDVYCEFTPLSEAEAEASSRDRDDRRAMATAHTMRIEQMTKLGDLLDASLRAVLELTQCERGFVLIDQGEGLVVRASLSLEPLALVTRAFSGSVGAVRRALRQRAPVVANEVRSEAWLAARDSVVSAGLSSLVCLPLLDGERVLGAIYADRVGDGPAISTLDLELLEAFAENAAVWIAARRASELLDAQRADAPPDEQQLADERDWRRIVAAHTGEIE
ncbi:GAF domain-containing protein [Lysobacter sp. D1-1-M9]|uniref:GAF domain-containing protein n=1 Tax=Novilysobacter longmucuonensis TaxID=3098603 RepID=UPI002FCC2407